jgi:hypothetical protein|tara:strand:+ start:1398 stop:1571 length:174 start_codon:yes stop_codon:yes gene_type:complete
MIKTQSKHVDFKKFTNKDGLLKGGVPVEMSKPNESQTDRVQGQKRMLKNKRSTVTWY